jgi:DNA/RNA-binding domain of Phe-tRNA-synthetase-like protein
MHILHSQEIWKDYPHLVAGVVHATGVSNAPGSMSVIERFNAIAKTRLDGGAEGEFPEVQAWRRTFASMGLKPTQYRCASESLLRRFRKEGALPSIHPLIDLCNAVSLAFAVPIAVFDTSRIAESVEVRHADGSEVYLPFEGEPENPLVREIIFADAMNRAHARRWTNRQSSLSAVRDETTEILIVAEALHDTALSDIERLTRTITEALESCWSANVRSSILSKDAPRFDF